MRIISGKFRGKKLAQPTDNLTRPLKDIVKESLFNLLNHSKSVVLTFFLELQLSYFFNYDLKL